MRNRITNSDHPLPPAPPTGNKDDAVLHEYLSIEQPIKIDYGTNLQVGSKVFINFKCNVLDTCLVSIGSRTLVGPNVCFFSCTYPLDPHLRNGTDGPELGRPVVVSADCWIARNVIILPGDVLSYHVVAGNPARILRKLERKAKVEAEDKKEGLVRDAEERLGKFLLGQGSQVCEANRLGAS
ncbi:trimeric LpxA-like protein [Thelonectria olida]|uniref:Trimeric LpxA-like protein n=1 Tax=Thelonectria olida TaxID=1576542 RepID=A0A9P9AMX3_9HYPO|nr:trimeric LpxA-like protein [Thelonectria olida]